MNEFIDQFENIDPNSPANVYLERWKRYETQINVKSFVLGFLSGGFLVWLMEVCK